MGFLREFIRSSKFVDMNKAEVYYGFESGLHCNFPNLPHGSVNYKYKCAEDDWFFQTYPGEPEPDTYDPRCRPWYKLQSENLLSSAFSDPYLWSTGVLGQTAVAPLVDIEDGKVTKFYGVLAMD